VLTSMRASLFTLNSAINFETINENYKIAHAQLFRFISSVNIGYRTILLF
jgi:hypothetical protein